MGYTKFCGDYGDWTVTSGLTKRMEHKASQSCEVDWSPPVQTRARQPDHRRSVEDLSIRERPALRPESVFQADVGHEAGHLAAPPCAYAEEHAKRIVDVVVADNPIGRKAA